MDVRQRAITRDEKRERREAILDAAGELLARDDYHDISIARVARKAGLAKGTIFLYFKTKEELFLQVQMREYTSWFEDVNGRLHAFVQKKKRGRIDEFVKAVLASVGDHPLMVRLTPVLHVVLERNIDYQSALEFKRFLLREIHATGRLIEQCLPFLPKNAGAGLLLHLQVVLIGLIQLSRPAPLVRRVIEKENMEAFRINFDDTLTEMLALLISGMQAVRTR